MQRWKIVWEWTWGIFIMLVIILAILSFYVPWWQIFGH